MELYTYKCEEEECQGNIYEIIFRSHIGIPILVDDNNQWIEVRNWEVAKQESKRLTSFCKGRSYFYAGTDVLVQINDVTLMCAILAAPFDKHTVHLSYGFGWHDWKQINHVYHLASRINDSQNPFPEFDPSNPAASIFNPTPYQTQLSGYNPNTIRKVSSNWGTYFGDGSLETRPTDGTQLRQHFSSQLRKQIIYPTNGVLKCTGGISTDIRLSQNRISQVIREDLLSTGTCYVPYIGTFSLKNGTLRFSASRLLRDRIHNRTNQNSKRQNIRDYGGEKQPSQSALLWTHRKVRHLSRRRQFIVKMKNIGVSNIVYQAFVDSLYLHLCNGKRVTITSIGTLRINQSKRISFRTSNKFRKIYKEHVAQSQTGDGNVG